MRSPKKRTGRRTALRGVQFRTQRRTAQPLRAAPPSWRSNRRRHIVLRTRPGGVPTNERGTHRGQRTLRTHANNPQTHIPHAAPVALCHERTDVGTFWWRGKGGWGKGGGGGRGPSPASPRPARVPPYVSPSRPQQSLPAPLRAPNGEAQEGSHLGAVLGARRREPASDPGAPARTRPADRPLAAARQRAVPVCARGGVRGRGWAARGRAAAAARVPRDAQSAGPLRARQALALASAAYALRLSMRFHTREPAPMHTSTLPCLTSRVVGHRRRGLTAWLAPEPDDVSSDGGDPWQALQALCSQSVSQSVTTTLLAWSTRSTPRLRGRRCRRSAVTSPNPDPDPKPIQPKPKPKPGPKPKPKPYPSLASQPVTSTLFT
jgi:hypothetical protein